MTSTTTQRWLRAVASLALLLALTLILATCAHRPDLQTRVQTLGTLRVALINSATSYFTRDDGAAGFEYDLVQHFTRNQGLKLQVIGVANRAAALTAVSSGRAHMAAGIAISRAARQQTHLTPPYSTVDLDVVYSTHATRPENLAALDNRLALRAHSALSEKFARLHPELAFKTHIQGNAEALMEAVAQGDIHSTIASNNLVAINQRYYPELRVAFTLTGIKRELAWAFPKHDSYKLYNQAIAWLAQTDTANRIRILRRRYFAHADELGFVGGRIFAKQIEQLLPKWQQLFRQAGTDYRLDWRLLAAMGYQESHWNPRATSPTGVRGLMMLTEATAGDLGVSDRLDPEQSIDGGARYLIQQRQRLPDTIKEPDRTWMALAAYNIGFGHLMDARRLLEARDENPDLWANVRQALTWLTKKKYLDETRYGYAHGYQAVEYVSNIRAYYDILLWITGEKGNAPREVLAQIPAPRPATRQTGSEPPDIAIDSPAL